LLAPLVAEFAQLYPGINFEFDLTPRQVDLVSEPVDMVIRMKASLRKTLPMAHCAPQWQASPVSVYALTETRLLPAKTQRFIEFLRERLQDT
jgi:DNA-binding transcriptional LysR family regulator